MTDCDVMSDRTVGCVRTVGELLDILNQMPRHTILNPWADEDENIIEVKEFLDGNKEMIGCELIPLV